MFQCPNGLELLHLYFDTEFTGLHISMPSRAYTSFLPFLSYSNYTWRVYGVNALSGLYLFSTSLTMIAVNGDLTSVSMPSRAYTSFLLPGYQKVSRLTSKRVSMPSRAYTSFLLIIMLSILQMQTNVVSMPSRAYTSFLRYPFKNLGFRRFPEPVFAGIYQNILTTAVFRAC